MANKYISVKTAGVDAKEFYRDLGFNMNEICNETGINRASLTRIPVHMAARRTVKDVVEYMEMQNGKMYEEEIARVQQNFQVLRIRAEEAWKRYQRCNKVLTDYRRMYDFEQKCPEISKVSEEDIFKRDELT